MHFIYLHHAIALSKLGPVAGPLGLRVLSLSGGNAHDPNAPRFPVYIGGQAEAARALGVSRSAVSRHWATFRHSFDEASPGRYYPGDVLGDPFSCGPMTRGGLPRYCKITPAAVQRLCRLNEIAQSEREKAKGPEDWRSSASLRLAAAAFRVALHLLPRIRAAAAQGDRFVLVSMAKTAKGASVSKSTMRPALMLLQAAGLLSISQGARWRAATDRGLLSETKAPKISTRSPSYPQAPRKCTPGVSEVYPSIYRGQDLDRKPYAPRPALGEVCPIAQAFQKATHPADHPYQGERALPGLTDKQAAGLARFVSSVEEAEAWIEQEREALCGSDIRSPARWFVKCAQNGWTAPGTPSARTTTIRGKRRERRPAEVFAVMQYSDPEPPTESEKSAAIVALENAHRSADDIADKAEKGGGADALAHAVEALRFVAFDAKAAAACYPSIAATVGDTLAAAEGRAEMLAARLSLLKEREKEKERAETQRQRDEQRQRGRAALLAIRSRHGLGRS